MKHTSSSKQVYKFEYSCNDRMLYWKGNVNHFRLSATLNAPVSPLTGDTNMSQIILMHFVLASLALAHICYNFNLVYISKRLL